MKVLTTAAAQCVEEKYELPYTLITLFLVDLSSYEDYEIPSNLNSIMNCIVPELMMHNTTVAISQI
jgi:hypothetical protein